MADSKVSQLGDAAELGAADQFPVVQGGVTKKATMQQLRNGTHTDTSTTIGLVVPSLDYTTETYNPSTPPNQAIRFDRISKFVYASNESNSGAGHSGAGLDWYSHTGGGDPNFCLVHESKMEILNNYANITSACLENAQLANQGTISLFQGYVSQIYNNIGLVSTAVMFAVDVASNGGTITTLYGFFYPDMSGISGITTKRSFQNNDANAPMVSAAPLVVSATQRASPTVGQTITVTANKDRLIITPAGTLATLTIALPAASTLLDGQTFEIQTSQTLTAITWTCSGSAFIVAPPSMNAAKGALLRWDTTNLAWWAVSY
jgi:hypothetical protein